MPSVQIQSITDKVLGIPLGRNIKDFLDYLTIEAGLSRNTILAYGRDLKSFQKYCKSNKINSMEQINPPIIQNYLLISSKNSKAESSIKRSLVAIRMLLRFAKLTGLINDDFTTILESPKLWQKLPVICSKKQVIDL